MNYISRSVFINLYNNDSSTVFYPNSLAVLHAVNDVSNYKPYPIQENNKSCQKLLLIAWEYFNEFQIIQKSLETI